MILAIFALPACATAPEEIPQDMSVQLFFKEAQEFMNALNWDGALVYLEELKRRFPDNRNDILAADYQIALIAYKQGQYIRALELFETILETYENDASGNLQEWVKVLSEKLIDRIENRGFSIPIDETTEDEPEPAGEESTRDAPEPAGGEAAEDAPAGESPTGDAPEPTTDEPAGDEAAEDAPAGEDPTGDAPEPTRDEPAGDEATEDAPEPAADEVSEE